MTANPPKFCFNCGAPRSAGARFCGSCGVSFTGKAVRVVAEAEVASPALSHSPPPLQRSSVVAPPGSTWQVAVGNSLPDASRLFDLPPPKVRREPRPEAHVAAPSTKGKSLWGSTLWMAVTQGADMVTRAMEGGGPNDPYLSLRLTIAAAVAVFGITLSSMPRLRSILVRLGVAAMAVLQGQGIWPVLKQVMMDPSILSSLAPNLAAQAAAMFAIFKLFQSAGHRR